jgi:hypothetical protein
MQNQLDRIGAGASWFESFIQSHPYVVAIVVAILCSWTVTMVAKKPLRAFAPVAWQSWAIRTFDVMVATAIAWRMWPGTHPELWALLIGSASPAVYWIFASLLCWKWPRLARFLTLRELAPESIPESETGDDTRNPQEIDDEK